MLDTPYILDIPDTPADEGDSKYSPFRFFNETILFNTTSFILNYILIEVHAQYSFTVSNPKVVSLISQCNAKELMLACGITLNYKGNSCRALT